MILSVPVFYKAYWVVASFVGTRQNSRPFLGGTPGGMAANNVG